MNNDNNNKYIDTVITLRQSPKNHKAIELIARLLKYTSVEEYVNSMVDEVIKLEIDGSGKLDPGDCLKLNQLLSDNEKKANEIDSLKRQIDQQRDGVIIK